MAELQTRMEQTKLLQFSMNDNVLQQKIRLNFHVPLGQAGDCGANSLYALDIISREIGVELSTIQNQCRINSEVGVGNTTEVRVDYLYPRYLFTDITKKYVTVTLNMFDLLQIIEQLELGKGTIMLMHNVDDYGVGTIGHYVTVYKNLDGEIQVIDLQRNELVPFETLGEYFTQRNANRFTIPTTNLKRMHEEELSVSKRRLVEGGKTNKRKTNKRKTNKRKTTRNKSRKNNNYKR
jgi:hypothetical protein